MRKLLFFSISIVILISLTFQSCADKKISDPNTSDITLDSTLVAPFFKSYPKLSKYKKELLTVYRNYDFHYIWFDKEGIVVYGHSLYNKVKDMDAEGISSTFPYQQEIDSLFEDNITNI